MEELHLPVEVLSFESDQPGSSGLPHRELPSAPAEPAASEGNRLAHASPLPWTAPPHEVGWTILEGFIALRGAARLKIRTCVCSKGHRPLALSR